MGSTGEHDRKRRHFSSVSPTSAAKKHWIVPCSEDRKLDATVLQFQNQKLLQQLEVQKVEYTALQNKFCQLKDKGCDFSDTLLVVDSSWKELVEKLEALAANSCASANGRFNDKNSPVSSDGNSSPKEDSFLCRLLQTCATDTSECSPLSQLDGLQTAHATTKNVLQNIVSAVNDLWHARDGLCVAVQGSSLEIETSIQLWEATNNLAMEVKNLRSSLSNLHSKQRSSLYDLQRYRDEHAKNKAEVKCLSEELEGTFAELEESNRNLIALKAQRNSAHGAVFPSPTWGSKHVAEDKVRDEQRELQDMEGTLKEFLDLSSNRLVELKSLYEDRIKIFKKLAVLQNCLEGVKQITSSRTYLLLREQLDKSRTEINQWREMLEKLQVEKDSFLWQEREVNLKVDLADIPRRASLVAESRIDEMEKELQKRVDEKTQLDKRLEDALRESGRREIIAEFKEMVLSFPKDMECIQSQLNHFKGSPSEIHSMRAEVQYLSNILERKKTELGVLSGRSAEQTSEIQKLRGVVHDLEESDTELTLILEMYRRESTDSRDVMELKDLEYKAWSGVQCLKSSLDEHSLELRVKAANEAEAISQQRLAAAEAEIADLRQKLEVSKRDICRLSEVLKSKHEEGEAYLSEIETIGQAYEDMQTQNRQLLQQVTERDDYNMKLVMETTKNRQLQETLRMEVLTMHQEMQQASESMNFYNLKVSLLEDQLRIWSEQIGKLLDGEAEASVSLESAKKRLMDAHKESQHVGQSLDERESKLETSRIDVSDLQIEMESERFDQKRIDEDIEILTRKVTYLQARREGSSVIEKLQQEIKEYKGILKCSVCHEREKQVVIAKCYHLFCHTCIQKTLVNRQRRCPVCSTIFGPNDVKPIYI
ncbi:E3 ubiquitin-protein ligase BRE1-like 1 [Acorus calamus]|uniref:E3 ubiquitin protein ligase n=1 Tax=Acorus calamus TaxID=4465 RepID=A0AAV9E1S3_ACOCL|nr:E3 ubiquitin-protein ligase BRE1-like 1 [Acorus calamus]